MAGTMLYEVDLPPFVAADDVAQRVLTVTIDGQSQDNDLGLTATVFPFKAPRDSQVHGTLVYYDDATPPNKSIHPSTFDFVASDTIPPADPGAMNVRAVGEE